MSEYRFTQQIASESILLRVTNVCSVCFCDINVGDTIFYDNEKFQYVCRNCAERILEQMKIEEKIEEGSEPGLFA